MSRDDRVQRYPKAIARQQSFNDSRSSSVLELFAKSLGAVIAMENLDRSEAATCLELRSDKMI
jgi:hypothetical protein